MSLKDDKQQNIQIELDFSSALTGEAREAGREETESSGAMNGTENPANTNRLMEEVCERENLKAALRQVKANKGSPGVDGMTVVGIKDYLKRHWSAIREQLLNGTYEPKPVRRVEISKPDGGVRKLGIPSVLDRFIQQAVLQVLQRRWDRTFSDHSYGFRPGRSAHQAVAQAQQYIAEGLDWCVDLDLEKFFDRVNHDKLMGQIAKRVEDKRLLKLIRAFLNAGVMENGLISPSVEGTPQGGPMTPRTQKITSSLTGGWSFGGNRVRIDACRMRLYVYDRCHAPARPRKPSASIVRATCCYMSINSPTRSSSWPRTAPFLRAKPIATSNKLSG
jgi:RNA-directed DNA polymerase